MEQKLDKQKEANVILNILYRRVFSNNQNLIGVDIGQTGSGKSYRALRRMELWYKRINKPFNIKNVCFSPEQIMERLNSNELIKGDMIILEEGGVNMGNLDFQTSMAKIFNYVLQSFRSLNIVLFINLPYFSMLNKNTRMLVHYMEESVNIDKKNKQAVAKPFLLQTNQNSGKVYRHYPKVLVDGSWERIQKIGYRLPSPEIKQAYEVMKEQFVRGLISGGLISLQNKDKKRLTPMEQLYMALKEQRLIKGLPQLTYTEEAEYFNVSPQRINQMRANIDKKGYDLGKYDGKSPEIAIFKESTKNIAVPT